MKTSKWTSTVCIGQYQIHRHGELWNPIKLVMPLALTGAKRKLISISSKTSVDRDILSLWLKYQYNTILNA